MDRQSGIRLDGGSRFGLILWKKNVLRAQKVGR